MSNDKVDSNGFRAGFVALVGLPNVGKSTLMNKIIGEKVSIVSSKPQTTRNAIYGIKTTDEYQAIFIDTPGFHVSSKAFNKAIVQQALDSIEIVDLICLLFDATSKIDSNFKRLIEIVSRATQPKYLVITKVDKVKKEELYKLTESIYKLCDFKEIIPVSAVKGYNVDTLLNLISKEIPDNFIQYDKELVTTQPEKFLISEYIREQLFVNLHDELPYDTLVVIEEFTHSKTKIDISAMIYVNRESQKGIVIGENGAMMKRIGIASRANIENFFGVKTNVKLWVLVKENWTAKEDFLNINL